MACGVMALHIVRRQDWHLQLIATRSIPALF
ncbi:hypothetical protein PSPPH_1144 [Pseudomonas savastanoi pv. phaseolicola 1448A]|uniref:Uncharacterized protein n=1 Tax=Pseudomonas savastanoi pv. phaseolicola (strain 1448A / Race 6) TaxID=264730 RepID=Q48MG0_PSE14|nr:hypothetical protein PSPPH_1144 [Pseudomonas savastanoi pv. phaseolicola 1448A]